MKDIYEAAIEEWKQGRRSVLATIIRQAGPSPRGIGAKCLLTAQGVLIGTIGGGRLEGQVLDEARKVLDSGLPKRLGFRLKGTDVEDTEMLCGGDVEVFLEPLSPRETALPSLFQELVQIHKRGGAGLLATVVDPERWPSGSTPAILLKPAGETVGGLQGTPSIEQELRKRLPVLLERRLPSALTLTSGVEKVEVFVEPVVSEPVLYVFGGGHVSQQIVPVASRVGFKVVVVDDRKDFADPGLFLEAEEVLQRSFEGVVDTLPVDASSYLVIVTRGHIHDKDVLAQALKTDARYMGMIGSRRKRDLIYQKLREEGFSEKDLARVHSPIGLSIGAETPEEIAVSIVAELVQERAGQNR